MAICALAVEKRAGIFVGAMCHAPALLGLTLLSLAIFSGSSAAATRIWIGKVDPFWSNPANWTNSVVPSNGDSLEFADDVKFRDTYNDIGPPFEIGSILIKGRNYVLRGNKINLHAGIVSLPGNSSNLITLDMNISAPLSISNRGYFNQLELAGEIRIYYDPLVLETSSSILISGLILDTNNVGVVQRTSAGTVSFAPTGRVAGTWIVEEGELNLGGDSVIPHLYGVYKSVLVVGTDASPPGSARAVWGANNKVAADTLVTVGRHGRLDLNGFSQTISSLSGAGLVDLDSGQLILRHPAARSQFAGELKGNGTLLLEGVDAGLELSGHSTFTGLVQTVSLMVTNPITQVINELASHLILSGTASNATVRLLTNSVLCGHGAAKSLITSSAVVRPGPGTLRFLDAVSLDPDSQLAISLDGPEAGSLETGQLNLSNAALNVTYQGTDPGSLFTLIAASATGGSTFDGMAEGAWLVAGDPAAPSEFRLTYAGNNGANVVLERTGLVAPPLLRIRQLTLGTRVVEWPIAAQGYTLQYSPTLTAATWTSDGLPVPNVTATDFFVSESPSGDQRYFRLIR